MFRAQLYKPLGTEHKIFVFTLYFEDCVAVFLWRDFLGCGSCYTTTNAYDVFINIVGCAGVVFMVERDLVQTPDGVTLLSPKFDQRIVQCQRVHAFLVNRIREFDRAPGKNGC